MLINHDPSYNIDLTISSYISKRGQIDGQMGTICSHYTQQIPQNYFPNVYHAYTNEVRILTTILFGMNISSSYYTDHQYH